MTNVTLLAADKRTPWHEALLAKDSKRCADAVAAHLHPPGHEEVPRSWFHTVHVATEAEIKKALEDLKVRCSPSLSANCSESQPMQCDHHRCQTQ